MKPISSTLVLALGASVSGCILLLDTDKLHSDEGAAGASGGSGAAGASGGASGAAGATGGVAGASGSAGGGNTACSQCGTSMCADEVNKCIGSKQCADCVALSGNPPNACFLVPAFLQLFKCTCNHCVAACNIPAGACTTGMAGAAGASGAAGKGG